MLKNNSSKRRKKKKKMHRILNSEASAAAEEGTLPKKAEEGKVCRCIENNFKVTVSDHSLFNT